jgi:mannose-1-phosphate guanylyltransferase
MSAVDAVVLVGGKGTRLRPLTLAVPKPLLPTAGLPFLTHLLSRIAEAGIEHVILGTSYKAETFEAEFGDGASLGLQMEYVTEERPLGTGGGIANVTSALRGDTVMVFNGDVLSGVDLTAMLASHHQRDADVTMYLVRVGDPRAFGSVPTDADGNVLAFLEKTNDPPTDQINAGCYIFKREILDRIPRGREVSVEREVFPALLADGAKVCGFVDSGYWRDMGTPEDFVRGSADLVRGLAPSPALGDRRGESLVHDDATVAPGAVLVGGTVVGSGAQIGSGVRLDGAVIFDGATVEAGAVVERSIIGFGARIGPRSLIRDGVIGDGADIGARCELLRGARVWPGVVIPDCGIRYSSDA